MRLSEYSDYALRVLMLCANQGEEDLTIATLAERLQVSRNHLMKIVNDLGREGVLLTTRGRGGGIRLARPAAEIRIGDVLRITETDFRLVECFDPASDTCTLTPGCRLRGTLHRALKAYLAELDGATLEEMARPMTRSAAPRAITVAPPRSRRVAA